MQTRLEKWIHNTLLKTRARYHHVLFSELQVHSLSKILNSWFPKFSNVATKLTNKNGACQIEACASWCQIAMHHDLCILHNVLHYTISQLAKVNESY